MTPQEKAIELMNRFEHQYNLDISEDIGIRGIDYEMAKQCALIAVNEIWNALESARVFEEYDYWQEVKQEIENI
jgi:hypothetical protein